jgi:septal ring factor EnvC (AmiA/AmiB activator)
MIDRGKNLKMQKMHEVNLMQLKKSIGLGLMIFATALMFSPFNVSAKDLSDEKYQVREAQKEYDKANQDYQVLSDTVKELEKRALQQSQQLETLKKGLPAKEDRLNKAQKALEEKQEVLDKAWEENKK